MIHFHDLDRPPSLHRHEDLARYLASGPNRPHLVSSVELAEMSETERNTYDRQRVIYLSGGIVLNTPDLIAAQKLLVSTFAQNAGRNSGHAGLMITGPSTIGKTTTAKALMRFVHDQYVRQVAPSGMNNRIPVMYVEVPAGSTAKLLMRTFAEFLGLSIRSGESTGAIRARVVSALTAARTQLIVVDEVHNLAGRTAGIGESVDLLKGLHNDVPATFLYAGIDLTRGELMEGPRGRQIAGRFATLQLNPLHHGVEADRRTWGGLINAFEKELLLSEHVLGTLAREARYLWERTGGSIGSLGRLLTGAAIEAITNPNLRETINRELLEGGRIDHHAEDAFGRGLWVESFA